MIGTWVVASLKQGTLEVKELEGPIECGIRFEWNAKIEEGDELELYKVEIHK
jgi:translation initiation factor IF-2